MRQLQQNQYLLILDNFESIVDPQSQIPLKLGFSELIDLAL